VARVDTSQYTDTHENVNTRQHLDTMWYNYEVTDETPAGRRLDRRAMKERTRQRLLDAAAVVFARRGIEGASLDEVAEAAGYTKGAIYSNFASKTDLIVALMERRITRQAAAAEVEFDGATLEQGLRALDERSRADGDADRIWAILAVEFWLQAMRDERARAAMAEQYERARILTAAMLNRKFAEAGAEPPLPPRDLAIVIEALGVGVTLQSLLAPESVSMGLQAKAIELVLTAGPPGGGAARSGSLGDPRGGQGDRQARADAGGGPGTTPRGE
jgi:AcrR family transcriptional regulator